MGSLGQVPTENALWGHLTMKLLVTLGQGQDTDSKASLLKGMAADIPHKCTSGN